MKNVFLFLLSILFCLQSFAQNVQWAFHVLEYSSQKESEKYSAKQVLGKPNVLPACGENTKAWQPKGGKVEYIKVGFLNPMKAKQLIIAESFHPGFVTDVFVYDGQGKEYESNAFKPKAAQSLCRLHDVNISEFDFEIIAVKIVLKPSKEPVAIDAIGLSESSVPYEIKLNQADVIKSNMVVKRLDNLNSPYADLGPLLSANGNTLYFSRQFDPANVGGVEDAEDIWFAEWDDKEHKWGVAKNMGVPLNNSDPNFINSVSPDGNTILLGNSYDPKGEATVGGGVSISYRTSKGWSVPKRLLIQNEENRNPKANFFMANSQRTLLMSVERKGDTRGDRDLYVSFLDTDSTWTTPLNLGFQINTSATEEAPFLASDDRTLYFTSNGFSGYGGSDIYVTRRLDSTWTRWSEPENLGPIINTANNENYFTISASGEKVFYTSTGDKPEDSDMFTLVMPDIMRPLPVAMIKGKVLDSKNQQPLGGVKVFFEDLKTGKERGFATSHPATGEYEIILPSGSNYGYLAQKDGYLSSNASLNVEELSEFTELRKDLFLTPLEEGQTLVLHNIFFEYNQSVLKNESFSELDRLARVLKDNPSMVVEVTGHTDNIGSQAYNDQLSHQRSQAVANYLVRKSGTEKEKIVVKYYGETKPVADNKTAVGRHLNRRVSFTILRK